MKKKEEVTTVAANNGVPAKTRRRRTVKPATPVADSGGPASQALVVTEPADAAATPIDEARVALASVGLTDDELQPTPPRGAQKASVKSLMLTTEDLQLINTSQGIQRLLKERNIKLSPVLARLRYEQELRLLQVELVKLQRWVQASGKRLAILFEGRDAAGKGGTIRRFTEHLNPRAMRVVALPKPTEQERGQWYFQRYARQLPNAGEIVFFDRSWYNRAVVEPVNGFCTELEYDRFMQQVPEFEHMLYEDGVSIIKFWFSISQKEQASRFEARRINPLKQWKLSPIDEKAQALWNKYTHYKEQMFSKTHTSFSPWIIVKANVKQRARLESIRYVLNMLPYAGKNTAQTRVPPDPNIVTRFHRGIVKID